MLQPRHGSVGRLTRFRIGGLWLPDWGVISKELAVGLFSKAVKSMDDLLLHGMKDIYYAEHQIVKALPKMIEKASNRDLTNSLKDHLEEIKKQIGRLDQVFRLLGQEPQGVRCPAIDGLIDEADEVAGEVEDKSVLDAAVIGSAQAAEHYEIARYETVIAWADRGATMWSVCSRPIKEEKTARQKAFNGGPAQRGQPQSSKLNG